MQIIAQPPTPVAMFSSLIQHRELLLDLVKRDFIGRYKGSVMGVTWSLLNPLLMLAIYTTVFSVAFKARWGTGEESKVAFALVLFSGMIVHSLFAECLNRAPGLIISHANYVKKVVFPLEILPWMTLFSDLLHFLMSFSVLLIFCLLAGVSESLSCMNCNRGLLSAGFFITYWILWFIRRWSKKDFDCSFEFQRGNTHL
jgi:lipopolysaccharide transport system permease protein